MIYVGYDPARPELVKIGTTKNVKRRRSTSRTTNPEFWTIKEVPGGFPEETELKKRFKRYRAFKHVREWFYFRGEVREWVLGEELEVPREVYKGYQAWCNQDPAHWYTRLHELKEHFGELDSEWERNFVQQFFLRYAGWQDRRFPPPMSAPSIKQIDKVHEIYNQRKAYVRSN